jgi:NTE family protein
MSFVSPHWRRRRKETASAATHRVENAFVLSGGGNQGVAQVGMLRALLERGFSPDVLIGTSAGALNAAGLAAYPSLDGVDRIADVWCNLRGESVFPGSRFGRAWHALLPGGHLYPNSGLGAVIDQFVGPGATFADLPVPLRVVATDLRTGDEVVLAAGPLRPALLASAALPGIFPAVAHDGRLLVDGGVVDNVPVSHALTGAARRVFVLNVSGGTAERDPRFAFNVLLRSFAISRNVRFEVEAALAPAGVDIIVLPRPDDHRAISDFRGAPRLIETAYEQTLDFLDQLALTGDRIPLGRRATA